MLQGVLQDYITHSRMWVEAMKQIKKITGRYRFTVERSLLGKVLSIDDYKLSLYPLTYTILDCLEHFCDGVGWELVVCQCKFKAGGTIILSRFFGERSFQSTLRKARTLYRKEQELSQW